MQTSKREEKLSEEIIDAHRTRAEYLKWKLLIVAALGVAGLGLSKDMGSKDNTALLSLIPLVCVYVDLLCANLNQRIILIGKFFAQHNGDAYERCARSAGEKGWFGLEDFALYGSTIAVCVLLLIFAFMKLLPILSGEIPSSSGSWFQAAAVAGGGLLGLILSRITKVKESRIRDGNIPVQVLNTNIRPYLRESYRAEDIDSLVTYLTETGVFNFNCVENGLFPAAGQADENDLSGYQYAWVRDNVHIAHAHFVWGAKHTAFKTADSLMEYFATQQDRIRRVINDPSIADNPMNRPHVRFDARNLQIIDEKWAHAQNDAIGYFIWFYCKTASHRPSKIDDSALETLALLAVYLQAIRYWEDKDSGHWEEIRKTGASSIGAVVAGLRQMATFCSKNSLYERSQLSVHGVDARFLNDLEAIGANALDKILPYESIVPDTKRRYDAALLFLIYPLEVVSPDQSVQLLDDVKSALQGKIGVRRYLGDSYWCPNYRELYALGARTADFSDDMSQRDRHVQKGEEAQWCIFDSIISCIHGVRALHGECVESEMAEQTRYLNRALGQLTPKRKGVPGPRCPEAYFYENERLVPNDHVPLQWAQANLRLALHWLKQVSLTKRNLKANNFANE